MTLIHDFIENVTTLHYMQNALVTAIVIGIVSGAVGCFIILRGMSLMGDAISHAVLPGVAVSPLIMEFPRMKVIIMEANSPKTMAPTKKLIPKMKDKATPGNTA